MHESPSPVETLLRAVESPRWGTTKIVLLKLSILLAFCGGPLLIFDLTKPVLQEPLRFALAFAPLVPIVFGAWSLLLWSNDSWDRFCVYAGFVGLTVLVGMDLYALNFFLRGGVYSDTGLVQFGIVIGALLTLIYVPLAMRRLREKRTSVE